MDDTTEIKKNNEISEFTASISVLDFNPQNYTMKMVFQQTVAQSSKLIFFNSVVMGKYIYFFAIDQLKAQVKSKLNMTLQLKKLNLSQIQENPNPTDVQ